MFTDWPESSSFGAQPQENQGWNKSNKTTIERIGGCMWWHLQKTRNWNYEAGSRCWEQRQHKDGLKELISTIFLLFFTKTWDKNSIYSELWVFDCILFFEAPTFTRTMSKNFRSIFIILVAIYQKWRWNLWTIFRVHSPVYHLHGWTLGSCFEFILIRFN